VYHPLQLTPGAFDKYVFQVSKKTEGSIEQSVVHNQFMTEMSTLLWTQGLGFVVSEAKKNKFRLLLSLVNNYGACGGKPQYVAWANQNGGSLNSEDDFFM